MYYAFGTSIISNLPAQGIALNPSAFQTGLDEQSTGSASMDLQQAVQFLQQFNMEVRENTDSTGNLASPLLSDLDSTSYAYGVYFAKNLMDLGMELKPTLLSAGLSDMVAGKSQFDELTQKDLLQQFNMMVQQKSMESMQAQSAEQAEPYKEEGRQFMAENRQKEGVIEHESGMQYEILKSGDPNGESPTVADKVTIHYEGRLLDGTVFDGSIGKGDPVSFDLGRLVRGWQIALPMMKPGDKWRLYLPPTLAYGDRGSPPVIPPGATLVFDIEYFGKG